MPIEHRRRAVEWWCHQHAENPTPLAVLARQPIGQPRPAHSEPNEPALYDTGISAEEGMVLVRVCTSNGGSTDQGRDAR